jgi:hypothetical protein|uniref:EG328479 protein n=1 Tax=Mus musculus TaxID=10090 RepID=A1L3C8_MOUSE|nr:EG328479 protein [Mus musculus]
MRGYVCLCALQIINSVLERNTDTMPHEHTFEEKVPASVFHSIDALDEKTDSGGDLSFIDKAEAGHLLYYTIPGNQLVGKPKLPPCHASSNTLGDPGGHQKSSCLDD